MDRPTRRRVLATGALGLATAAAGCTGGGPVATGTTEPTRSTPEGPVPADPAATVGMGEGLRFEPREVRIAPGETVLWENGGTAGHSVTAYGGRLPAEAAYFASGGFGDERTAREAWPRGEVAPGGRYWHTFETPGRFPYFFIPHEANDMVGVVEVTAGGTTGER